jgi:hypothetical protein
MMTTGEYGLASSLLASEQEAIMKIDPNMAIGSVTGTQVKPQGGAKGAFEEVLKGLETGSAPKLEKVSTLMPTTFLNPQKLNALSLSEEALDLLERYSQAVSDPSLNLKSIAPMVDELDGMRQKVIQSGSFIADDDPLKGIMNEVSSALYGEVLRFKRGELIG